MTHKWDAPQSEDRYPMSKQVTYREYTIDQPPVVMPPDPPPINQVGSGVRIPADERRGMARKRYTAEEIIGHLRTIEIETGKGFGIAEVCRKLGITEQNCEMSC
jgi:hypothetical protein